MKADSTPHPNQLKIALGLTKYSIRATLRNRTGLFFSLIFPLAFVLIFGAFSNGSTRVKIAVADSVPSPNPIVQAVKKLSQENNSPVTYSTGSASDLETQLSKTNIDAVIEPDTTNTSIKLLTTSANTTGSQVAKNLITGLVSEMNYSAAVAAAGSSFKAPFRVDSKDIAGRTFTYLDFVLPGQMAFSLLSLSTFGVAFSFITLRRNLVLKRMFATSVKPIAFVAAECLSRAVQAIIQACIILFIGIKVLNFHLAHGTTTFFEMMLIIFLGVLAFLAFGMLIANIAKDEQSAPVALNLFNLPQMLLGGIFFPTDSLPSWLGHIGSNLPLAYLATALRNVAINGDSLTSVAPYLLGMAAWSAIAYILAARTFKTE